MVEEIKKNLFLTNYDMIIHQVNCKGVMGKGFAKQITDRFPEVYVEYNKDYISGKLQLGYSLIVKTCNGKYISNICAQNEYGYGKVFTNYEALRKGLYDSLIFAEKNNIFNISIPGYIGAGLAGGDWNVIKPMIYEIFGPSNVIVTICYI